MYPRDSTLGDTCVFTRPHEGKHKPKIVWETKLGGALSRCSICGKPIELAFIVTGQVMPPEQLEWVLQAGEETGLKREELFSN